MNYKEYRFSTWEILQIILGTMVITITISFLFYRSLWGCLLFPFVYTVMWKVINNHKIEQRTKLLKEQFLNGMRVLNSSIQAGLSMENSWKEVEKETGLMYGKQSLFYREVKEMNHQVSLNIPIEKLFLEFGYRTEQEDMIHFAEILDYGKRTGGDWKKIIDVTVYRMSEKQDAQKEIEVMVAAKKMEQKVMSVIPLGMLAFLQISSWEYMAVLYHNPLGIICMSVCLIGYAGALFLARKMLQIKV